MDSSSPDYARIIFHDICSNEQRQAEIISQLQTFHETSANIKSYLKELRLEVFVPLTAKAKVRGQLEHMNEVLVSIGCDYFVKMTIASCGQYLHRRIKVFEDYLSNLRYERSLLQQRQDFGFPVADNSFEIMEKYDEQEEERWRIRHRESTRKHLREERRARNEDTKNYLQVLEELELLELRGPEVKANQEIVQKMQQSTDVSKLSRVRAENPNQDVVDYLDTLDINELISDVLDTVVHKVSKTSRR